MRQFHMSGLVFERRRILTGIHPLFLASLLVVSNTLNAQVNPPEPEPDKQVHWALGSIFGTGWYQIDENRTAYILRMAPRQTLREATLDSDGNRTVGVEFQYAVSVGVSDLDDIPDFIDFDNYQTFSFTPGVAIEVPINPKWSLRPYAHLGYGWETGSGEGAGIWYGGIRSRYRLSEGRVQWSLLNGAFYAGYKPQFEERGQYGSFSSGLEFSRPLGLADLDENGWYLNGHLNYSWYWDDLQFHVDRDTVQSIRDQWDVGLAIGKRESSINIWFMSFDQIGLAYKFSSNGKLQAITLNFRSPFSY